MIKFSKYLLLPAVFLGVTACTDLEENLRGDITRDIKVDGISTGGSGATSDGLEAAFGGLRNVGTAFHGAYYSIQEITSDEMCIGAKGGDWYDGGILVELHKHTYTPAHGMVEGTWNNSYSAINTCNELLTGGSLDANKTAQIRALRAYHYLRLCFEQIKKCSS